MNHVNVSIIIPVFNGSRYIERCLDSILKEKVINIEVIIIDDGSTDDSLNKLLKYQMNDKRVNVIKQSNKGAASARNTGILKANGEYIGFVDIDDYIESNMYSKLYKKALERDADIVCCNYEEIRGEYKILFDNLLFNNDILCNEQIGNIYFDNLIVDKHLTGLALWNKIFKRELIINNNIRLDNKKVLGEDRKFISQAILKSQYITMVDEVLYFYIKENSNSLTSKYDKKNIIAYLDERKEIMDFAIYHIKDTRKISILKNINNNKIFYKLLDFCLKEINSKEEYSKKYKNVRDIFEMKDMKRIVDNKINININLKIFLLFYRMKMYRICYILLFIKSVQYN